MARGIHAGLAAAVLAAASLLAGCGTTTDQLSIGDGPAPAGGNAILPAHLKAHRGHNVLFLITNTAPDKVHGFSIDELKVQQTIGTGETVPLMIKAVKAGTYRLYCHLHPAHEAAELVVS